MAVFISPETTPGVMGLHSWIYRPSWYNVDVSVNKTIPIHESVRLTLKGEFLNAFNHPTFGFASGISGLGDPNAQDFTFGQITVGPANVRVIELRAEIQF